MVAIQPNGRSKRNELHDPRAVTERSFVQLDAYNPVRLRVDACLLHAKHRSFTSLVERLRQIWKLDVLALLRRPLPSRPTWCHHEASSRCQRDGCPPGPAQQHEVAGGEVGQELEPRARCSGSPNGGSCERDRYVMRPHLNLDVDADYT